jgi:cytochrome o ubiquinol oxidase subunit I
MGMTRRMNHYDVPGWHPYLIVALIGAVMIGAGILAILVQFAVSIRDRNENRDWTGDPWNARSLEWSTASPAPFYNFAHIPHINSLEQHWENKERGRAWRPASRYSDIHMPKNTSAGFVIGVFSFVLSFALVWHMWAIAAAGLLGMVGTFIARSYDRDTDYYVPAVEVARIERERHALLAKAG